MAFEGMKITKHPEFRGVVRRAYNNGVKRAERRLARGEPVFKDGRQIDGNPVARFAEERAILSIRYIRRQREKAKARNG